MIGETFLCRVKIKDIPGPRLRLRRGEGAVGVERTYHHRPWYCGGEWFNFSSDSACSRYPVVQLPSQSLQDILVTGMT